MWTVLRSTCVKFFDDNCIRVDSGDIGDLSGDFLMLGANAAISINHNVYFLSALKLTKVSFCTIIMPCFGPFVSAFGAKLVQCLQRFVLILDL